MKLRKPLLIIFFSTALGFGTAANAAPIYEYSIDNPNGSAAGGDIKNITTRYDAGNETFYWEYTVEDKSDSFWLVVNGGPDPSSAPNPKGQENLTILFGDLDSNATYMTRLWAYDYDGTNSSESWNAASQNDPPEPRTPLAVWDNQINVTDAGNNTKTVSFSIDVSPFNTDPENPGIAFGDRIGIWFHPATGSEFSFVQDMGSAQYRGISGYTQAANSWHDTSNKQTYQVPEPGSVALFAMGGLAFGALNRRRRQRG